MKKLIAVLMLFIAGLTQAAEEGKEVVTPKTKLYVLIKEAASDKGGYGVTIEGTDEDDARTLIAERYNKLTTDSMMDEPQFTKDNFKFHDARVWQFNPTIGGLKHLQGDKEYQFSVVKSEKVFVEEPGDYDQR